MSSASSIGVTPGFQEISLHPGEVYHGTFSVVNASSDESNIIDYKAFVAPFSVSDDNYSVNFDITNDFTQITNWITIENPTGSIKGKEVLEIPFTISVPENAPGGGQYAAFIARIASHSNSQSSDIGDDDEYAISINYQAASILYVALDGEIREEGKITNNSVDNFFFSSPIVGQVSIRNSGNTHFNTSSYIQVFPLFSEEEIYSSAESPKTNIVLPETTLSTFNSWDDTPQLGVFRVVQTVSYLGNVATTEKTVFVCPLWFLVLWIIFIFGIILYMISRSRSRKKSIKHAKEFTRQ